MRNHLLLTIVVVALAYVADANRDEYYGGCFCPCRIPGSNNLRYPSDECLRQIKCEFGKYECGANVMAMDCKPKELCFCPCRIPGCHHPDVLYYPSKECLKRIKCKFGEFECSAEYLASGV